MTIRQIGGVFGRHPEFQTATVKGDLLLGTALQFEGGARLTSNAVDLVVDRNINVNGLSLGRARGNTADSNTVLGFSALPQTGYTGSESTAIGWGALFYATGNAYQNTAIGCVALFSATGNASQNTAIGRGALFENTSGRENTAVGVSAGSGNTSGNSNVFIGAGAGGITTGSNNTVIGHGATASSTTVSNETTIGKSTTTNTRIFGTLTLASTGVIWATGAGSPEGVVTAVPGSLYTDTNGGAGATLYAKETGTGNTGWVAK